MNTFERLDKLSRESTEIVHKTMEIWKADVVFSWRWWFGVCLTILVWLFWARFHKKESRYRLLAAGFFVMTISVSLDSLGVQMGLWSYRYEVIPLIPAYIPFDLAMMPVVIMSLIQIKPNRSHLLKAFIFGLLSSFVGEPLIVWTNIYHPVNWHFYYSFPIYIAIYLIAHWLTTRDRFEKVT